MLRLNEYDKLVIRNGCRPAWLSKHLPQKLEKALSPFFDLIFKEACNAHDDCFFFGGDLKDFNKCNKNFYKALKKAIARKAHWYSKWYFYFKAWEYYKLVQKFGKSSFYFNSGSGLDRLNPSLVPYKDSKIREMGVEVVWIYGRWYTRKEALELGLIERG